MSASPAAGLARLRDAAADGTLDVLCAEHGALVLTVFGSTTRGEPGARDLDIGVLGPVDVVALATDLVELTGVERVDVAHLDRAGPVLRERALVGCVPLFESVQGRYASAQVAAVAERIETDWLRRLDLELMQR